MSSASFVVLCALVGSIFATPPLPRPSNDTGVGVVSLSRTDSDGFINSDFSNDMQFELKLVMYMVGRIEYLSMADGSHLLVPLSGNTDSEREYKTVSIAVSKLITNLTSMERTDKVIINVTEELIMVLVETKTLFANDTESLRSALKIFLHSYIESIDKKFGIDEELAAEYKKQKSMAKQFVERDPKMQDALFDLKNDLTTTMRSGTGKEKMKVFLQRKDTFCEGLANLAFVEFLKIGGRETFNSTDYKRYLMARALIRKAQSSGYESKVNQVYHNALVQVRPHVVANYTNDSYIPVFPLIEKELASDPTLQKEIGVLMKQIEDNPGNDGSKSNELV